MTARPAMIIAVALVSLVASEHPGAQQRFTDEELHSPPYSLNPGRRDTPQQIEWHEQLATIAEKAGDPVRAARHYVSACTLKSGFTRDPSLSAPSCERARTLAEAHDVRDVKIQILVATGIIRAWTFNFPGAIAALTEAIKLGDGLNPDLPVNSPLISAHHLLGSTLVEFGQFDQAGKELVFARDHCRTGGNAMCAAYADIWLCRLHTMLGDFGAARTACDAAGAEAAVDHNAMVMVNLGWMRGSLDAAIGRPAASLAALQGAWQSAQSDEAMMLRPIIAQLIVDALIGLARVNEAEAWQHRLDQGLKDGTIPFFFGPQIAMRRGLIAAVRGRLDEAHEAFLIASRSVIQEMSIRGHVAASRMDSYRGDYAEARQSLERAIEKIEAARTGVAGSALRASYLTMHSSAYRELIGVRWDAEGAAAAPALLELAEAGRARALLDALASSQVAGATAPTLTAAAVQGSLRPDDVLIEYVSADHRLIAITVTRDRIVVTPLIRALTADDLKRRVEFFSTLTQESDEAALAPSAKRLYDDLLGPALEGVGPDARTLIIAADGPLHTLPFDALGDSPRVIDRWNVVMVPSASALANRVPHGAPTSAALVVAAPTTSSDLEPLLAAPEEAAAIRSRIGGTVTELSGTDATEARLQSAQPDRFAVLHFASHAVVDEERPLRSALMLAADGASNDARWSADEIYRSKLRADLVVLSACSTAAGAAAAGEGVMSLARAFLYAGAGATVATLWDVPDAPGPLFADVLYRELAAGQPLGTAAADARRELRRRGAPPRSWAAYVLTGNPGARVAITARTPARVVAAWMIGGLAIAVLLSALIVGWLKVRPARLGWAQLATASVVLAAVAMTTQLWPARDVFANASLASRGTDEATLAPMVSGRVISWPMVAGADEHVIQLFDEAGRPAGPERTAVSPFTVPQSPAAAWLRVSARRNGDTVARSSWIPVGS